MFFNKKTQASVFSTLDAIHIFSEFGKRQLDICTFSSLQGTETAKHYLMKHRVRCEYTLYIETFHVKNKCQL